MNKRGKVAGPISIIAIVAYVVFSPLLANLLAPTLAIPYHGITSSDHDNFISISIIIDRDSIQYFDILYSWLPSVNYTNFTFVIDNITESFILNSTSRLDLLKHYGRLIPRLDYCQELPTEGRSNFINETITKFKDKLGYVPTVFMDFMPDTFTANELLDNRVQGYQGYCFDQYAIDHITERGGFQMPYYASSTNILVPSQAEA